MSQVLPLPIVAGRSFRDRYGPWALVAGASEGLGAAYAEALARRGLHLLLIARRTEPLEALAASLRAAHGVEVRTVALDLAADDVGARMAALAEEHAIGVAVYNAAYAPVGAFLDRSMSELQRAVDVNVRGPLACVHALAPPMVARGRGGLVLMSSLAGFQGSPRIATYAATKAFNTILGESLWGELGARGVDVLVCSAGAIRTPNYTRAAGAEAPGTMEASAVAEQALHALGRGPLVVPGFINRLGGMLLGRLLPRRVAVRIMAKNTQDLS